MRHAAADRRGRLLLRAAAWTGAAGVLAMAGRALSYALAPASPLRASLAGTLGGPGPLVVGLVAFAIAITLAAATLWLCALGVRERHRLATAESPVPRLRLKHIPARAVALLVSSALVFALIESYLHWRAGLGFHGIHCLMGPVHQGALPILSALSLLGAALAAAGELVLAWMRRTVALLLTTGAPSSAPPLPAHAPAPGARPSIASFRPARPRAPPRAAASLAR